MRLFILTALLLTALLGCGDNSSQGNEMVQIRIRNSTGMEIENFWLGAGGRGAGTQAYGVIEIGETTRYIGVEPILARYRKLNFITVDGKQHLDTIDFEPWVGSAELAPGRYTFDYALVGGQPQLTLIVD